jgi:hypothetical protein
MDSDMNLWGIFAMPVGVLLCFGPVLVAWMIVEFRTSRSKNRKDGQSDIR